MKRFLLVGAAAIALVVGAHSKAEAVTAATLHICQGAICVDFVGLTSATTPGMVPIVIGDYELRAGGGTLEFPSFSQSATVGLQVRRVGFTSTDPLDIFFQALGFATPTPGDYILDTTLAATSSPTSPGSFVAFQAWLSTTNSSGFGPPIPGVTAGPIACAPTSISGPGSCNTSGPELLISPGVVPFSLTTQTRFNLAFSDTLIYGSTGQAIVTSAAIPEPMSLMLLGSGLVGLASARRRLKK